MSRLLALVASLSLLPLAGCSSPQPDASGESSVLLDVWTVALGSGAATYAAECPDVFSGYVSGIGARGLACSVHQSLLLESVVSRFDGAVYASGPHSTQGAFSADLLSDDFGHYNPRFVEWVVDHAIIGEDDPAIRALLAPIYARRVQRMARVYWMVYQDLASEGFPARSPAGAPEAYARYLETGVVPAVGSTDYYPGFSMTAFSDRNEDIADALGGPGREEFYPALYEANTAVGFWLRRRADGTQAAFRDGLRELLSTYDEAWLLSTL